ncbi:MAG: hypothetical protein WDN10_01550 [bacterium]
MQQGISVREYYYSIRADTGRRKYPTPDEVRHLQQLRGRIEQMAKKELGRSFLGLSDAFAADCLFLLVKTGTSKDARVKFKLRSLLGRIELFDSEKARG